MCIHQSMLLLNFRIFLWQAKSSFQKSTKDESIWHCQNTKAICYVFSSLILDYPFAFSLFTSSFPLALVRIPTINLKYVSKRKKKGIKNNFKRVNNLLWPETKVIIYHQVMVFHMPDCLLNKTSNAYYILHGVKFILFFRNRV